MLTFWAKSGGREDVAAMHSVPHHSLDVAACAFSLAPTLRPPVEIAPATLAGLTALHDIGKFTRTFQAKVEALWPDCLGPYTRPPAGWPHDEAGYALLWTPLALRLAPLLGTTRPFSRWSPILAAIAGHHGRPPPTSKAQEIPRDVACATCLEAAGEFVDAVLDVLAPPPIPTLDPTQRAALAWWLAGLTTLADWMGSSRVWFPPVQSSEHTDLHAYWRDLALPRAGTALQQSGLLPSRPAPASGITHLFPALATPRPLQLWADALALPEGPALFVIEDATGAGKTEAALVLAQRLMAAGRGRGVYFALPTMATANAMYGRLEQAYERLFAPDARPSLVLAHGRRMLNPRFIDSILSDASDGARLDSGEAADQPGAAQCAAWIADDRRKAFLAEIGVGTIDQALLAVLPARHAMLRLLGLSQRVLIIDEAHAYGAYEGEELTRLLQFHAALGGSAIVLSATLTARRRAELCDSLRAGLRLPPTPSAHPAYPLATIASGGGIRSEEVPMAAVLTRRVAVARMADKDAGADALLAAAQKGAAVAWVRNAVDDAIEAAAVLRARGLDPLLFHARFAMGDRLAVEEKVLARFGVHSTPEQRRNQVLVATQVVEQSLDIDFDLMVTDLAPADLVIQRAGRVWRHARSVRPVPGPQLLLLAPEPVADPPEGWLGSALRRTGFVYVDHALLWRSARALLDAGAIVTPDNVRALVEAAYDREAPDAEPAGLERATRRAEAKRLTARGVAWQNLLKFEEPYRRDAGQWEPDVCTPTRLGDPQVTLRVARVEDGRVVPWCADPDPMRAWTLSEVSVRAGRLAQAAPDALDTLIEAAKREWPAWEREIPTIVLRNRGDGVSEGAGISARGAVLRLTYSSEQGLVF